MITGKVIYNPNGYVEMASYQSLGDSFSIERNNYFPINTWTLYQASKSFPELKVNIDKDGNLTYINPEAQRLYNISYWLQQKHYFGTKEIGKKWEHFLAYMFATIKHETYNTYNWEQNEKYNTTPKEEFPGQIYFKEKYDIDKYENKKGTLDYYNFRGRGLVQITWRGNYRNAENEIKILNYGDKTFDWTDFHLVDPNGRGNDSKYAANANKFVPAMYIMSYGMQKGWFRKDHTLEKYWKLGDWYNARQIIQPIENRKQKTIAKTVQGYYNKFYKVIHENSGL